MVQQKTAKDFDEQIVTLERTLQILQDEENADVLLETTLTYLQSEFDYNLIWIGLYDRLDHKIIGKGGITPNGDTYLLKQRFILQPGDLLEQVVIQLRPVGVSDLREETRAGKWRQAAQTFNIQGTILFPIRYKDRCYGVALLGSHSWGTSPKSGEKSQLSIVFGALATSLYHIELEWQRQQMKRPDQPLFALLSKLADLDTLDHWLEAVVEATHEFMQPTRTNIYWYYPDGRYFWRRTSNRLTNAGLSSANRPASGITVQDLGGFYQALNQNQVVSIGESHSSLKADITERLMQQIRSRSLLAAPILLDKELLGFLAVEGNHPRIWQEDERNYLRGAAQLVAITAPLAQMEEKIRQTEMDQALTSGITRAIYTDQDWQGTLKMAGEQLCQRLKAEYFLLLTHNSDLNQFEPLYQYQPPSRKPTVLPLTSLDSIDTNILMQASEAVSIENWDEDTRFLSWRDTLQDIGIRSLLLCNTGKVGEGGKEKGRIPERIPAGKGKFSNAFVESNLESKMESRIAPHSSLEGVLILGQEATRTWNRSERELVHTVSQQLGLIVHQWQLQRQSQRQQRFAEALATSFANLRDIHPLETLETVEKHWIQHIANITQAPLAALITWSPGHHKGRIAASVVNQPQFSLGIHETITIQQDSLIQNTLSTADLFQGSESDLSNETRRWLRLPEKTQLFALPLRTAPEHLPCGIILVSDYPGSRWSELSWELLTLFVNQLAWFRRFLTLQRTLQSQQEELEGLNWYKQRRLEDIYRIMGVGIKQLHELSQVPTQPAGPQKDTLTTLRYQQLLRQMGNAVESTLPLLKQEIWHLQTNAEIIPLANLLRRISERIKPLIKQRQLQFSVERAGNLSVRSDAIKLELILYELLILACHRCQSGDKIEIRCQLIEEQWLELSMIDNGTIEPKLILEMQQDIIPDLLAPSTLHKSPGKNIMICKRLLEEVGSQFYMDQLGNKDVIVRLRMPLATVMS